MILTTGSIYHSASPASGLTSTAPTSLTPTSTASHGPPTPTSVKPNFGIGYGTSSGPGSLMLWQVGEMGQLSWKEPGAEWQTADAGRPFKIAPVVVATAEDERAAIAVDQQGYVVCLRYQDGSWGSEDGWWVELGRAGDVTRLGFTTRPAAISRAEGLIDVFAVDGRKQLVQIHFDGTEWGEWELVSPSVAGKVTATSSSEDRIDVFSSTDKSVDHKFWTPEGWSTGWENLGYPDSRYGGGGFPIAASFKGINDEGEPVLQMDVIVAVESIGTLHKPYLPNGEWDGDWHMLYASHEGYEFANAQVVVAGGPDAPVNLFSRGTDDCIHYNLFNGTGWAYWKYLWCYPELRGGSGQPDYPTHDLAIAAVSLGNGIVDVVQETVAGELLHLALPVPVEGQSYPNDWTWDSLGRPGS